MRGPLRRVCASDSLRLAGGSLPPVGIRDTCGNRYSRDDFAAAAIAYRSSELEHSAGAPAGRLELQAARGQRGRAG
jgi:hypothetical protein